ncbi:peptidylprolyl isomerase [Aurantiacibacter gangjinensis]|uniref:Peptidylprolyl isomerase n=1 Tax=Aurantiacibacter gangjinensis TaxID=502682 RepID=A0A0G9MNL3_9SPHN|nr:peptidylprolyl isomerase [Aurantiacibacter gangjinensis]KLE32295.1 peptidylprolyl isomerase [Aurantiacibacter gangjinensis]
MKHLIASTLALALSLPAIAQEAEPEPATPTSVVAAAQDSEWIAIAPDDLLVMDLAPDSYGSDRRVVIQLIPPPFSQPWVENIRTLARAHWWDGTSINRVQDNYVTQWGDVTEEKPVPIGIESPSIPYEVRLPRTYSLNEAGIDHETATFTEARIIGSRDSYASLVGTVAGWPVAMSLDAAWPIHCYGYVGVGRSYAPDTGTGAELYTIIGQPQRHMDRNLAVVGRIIDGMEHLSSLPRGSGELGFYSEEEAHLRTPILSVRLASEMEDAPSFEYLSTESQSFAAYVAVRANRDDAFYTVPAGGVDVCNVEVPVRRVDAEPQS